MQFTRKFFLILDYFVLILYILRQPLFVSIPLNVYCPPPAKIALHGVTVDLHLKSKDNCFSFWDVDTGEMVTQSPAYDCSIEQMHFAEDGRYLIVGTGRQM